MTASRVLCYSWAWTVPWPSHGTSVTAMPKYFEYVFAAYAIWIGAFALYALALYRRHRALRRALERLGAAPPTRP